MIRALFVRLFEPGAFISAQIGPERLLIVGFAASFAAKLGDTFGSEIGKRWGRNTVLITSLRAVPPGTDGAISFVGTLASCIGSLLMTVTIVGLFFGEIGPYGFLVFLAGLLATLFESLIGAVVQERTPWLTNEVVNALQTSLAAFLAIFFALILS